MSFIIIFLLIFNGRSPLIRTNNVFIQDLHGLKGSRRAAALKTGTKSNNYTRLLVFMDIFEGGGSGAAVDQ